MSLNSFTYKNLITSNQNLFFVVLLGIAASFMLDFLLGLILGLLLIFLIIGYGRKFLISIILVSLLSFASDINVSIRMIIQIFSFTGLLYLFLDKYGLKSSSYPNIPSLVKSFLILFYISMIISIVFSNYPLEGMFLLLRVSVFFFISYIFYSFLNSYDDIDFIIKGLIIACVVISFGIYYQLITEGFNLFDFAHNSQIRIAGFNSNINASAGVFAAVLPVITSLFFYKKERIYKAALGLIILFIVVALLLTNSRAATVSITISFFIILFQLRRKLFFISISVILSLILVVYFIEPLAELFSLLMRLDAGFSFREMYWNLSTNIIKDNLIFGIGPGNYRYVMFDHYPVMMDSGVSWFMIELQEMLPINNNSHNFYLMFFSDMGILGFITSLSLPLVFFIISFRTIDQLSVSDGKIYYIILGIIAAGIGLFFRGMFEAIGLIFYGYITADLPFWILFGILIFTYINLKKNQNFS